MCISLVLPAFTSGIAGNVICSGAICYSWPDHSIMDDAALANLIRWKMWDAARYAAATGGGVLHARQYRTQRQILNGPDNGTFSSTLFSLARSPNLFTRDKTNASTDSSRVLTSRVYF
jgi:hypothetical protein